MLHTTSDCMCYLNLFFCFRVYLLALLIIFFVFLLLFSDRYFILYTVFILIFVISLLSFVFFFKQKTAYDVRISYWSSDVCSSDLLLLARRMSREGNDVVIVESDSKRVDHLEEALDATIVRGSAASIRTLQRAGLNQADMLIAVTNSDEVNFLACLIAQNEGAAKVRIARMRTPEVDYWRDMAQNLGLEIDLIIHPESEVAERIIRVLPTPADSDIFDFAGGLVRLFGMMSEPA